MEPIKTMESTKLIELMEPMKPMALLQQWWSKDLGEPTTSGGQNGMRYAFFPQKERLLIERNGTVTTYESGDHRISGVAQQQCEAQALTFTSQNGLVNLQELKML